MASSARTARWSGTPAGSSESRRSSGSKERCWLDAPPGRRYTNGHRGLRTRRNQMRRVLAATFVLALALALSAPAMAAPSPKKLAAQIAVLQKQVKALQKQVKKLNTAVGQTQTVA